MSRNDGMWQAPGRVNLIGEHTDYSGGFVLPMALPQTCRVTASARSDGTVTVRSAQRPAEPDGVSAPAGVQPGEVPGWAGYGIGIAWALREAGHEVPGADLLLDSSVPIGAGLSSSAAVGCSVALALRDLFELPLDRLGLAAIARRCENEFVGAPTGVMDQAASLLATAGNLLFLDTRSMAARQVPFDLAARGLTLLVIDSRTRHELTDGGYGSRRAAVEEGARLVGVTELRDVAPEDLDKGAIEDDVVARRVRHVVTENERVLAVVDVLTGGGDPRAVGPILTAGHASLRDDFEISTPELDAAVEAALRAGAYGARMTGGGVGGSAIALIDTAADAAVRAAVEGAYAAAGYEAPRFFTATPSAGAARVS
jgi:galactokinase